MKVAILSDMHGNLAAATQVAAYLQAEQASGVLLLGDLIDYGMHSNEVVDLLRSLPYPVFCNIRGNHEQAILTGEYTRFSSARGRECAKYTKSVLSESTWTYLRERMSDGGMCEFTLGGKACLAVHGSLADPYWKSISPGQDLSPYRAYDYVFSGHSHLPHFFEVFHAVDDPANRNKKKTVFLNPGSVGQPRNLNPMAQFAILDFESGEVRMIKLPYDVAEEQKAYAGQVDDFYRARLERGL